MKVSKAKVAENRSALVSAASVLLKEKGFDGAGVIEISARAGLSQGAFYGHFPTKGALAAASCKQDLTGSLNDLSAIRGPSDSDAWAYIRRYLRQEHVDDIAGGCPVATYSGEIARQGPEVASAFSEGTGRLIELFQEALGRTMAPAEARVKAVFLMAAMSGAIAMARAVKTTDVRLSSEILDAALRETAALVGVKDFAI